MHTPTLSALLLLAVAGTGCSHFTKIFQDPPAAEPSTAVDPSKPNSPANTSEVVATNNIVAQIAQWRLGPVDIKNDLDGGVTIVRTRENTGGAPTGRSDNDALTSQVKQRLESDADVGRTALEITANNGEVALRGRADSAATIGRAIAIALDTPGVTKVTSDIKADATVKPATTRP